MAEAIFQDVDWSTDRVLQQSLAICKNEGLSFATLPELNDIDNEDDLKQELKLLGAEEDVLTEKFVQDVSSLVAGKLS